MAGDTHGLSACCAVFGAVLAGFLFAVSSHQIVRAWHRLLGAHRCRPSPPPPARSRCLATPDH
ncbi:hypothetical protein ACQ4WX_46175 [Streptomyces lasalocidi]